DGYFFRHRPVIAGGDGARTNALVRRPAGRGEVRFWGRRAALAKGRGAGLAPGMAELDTEGGAAVVNEIGNALERCYVMVAPQARIEIIDARFRRDRRALDEDEGGAAGAKLAEMDEVPVAHRAVFERRVLAHRRNDDAVLQRQRADRQRREKLGDGMAGVFHLTCFFPVLPSD